MLFILFCLHFKDNQSKNDYYRGILLEKANLPMTKKVMEERPRKRQLQYLPLRAEKSLIAFT